MAANDIVKFTVKDKRPALVPLSMLGLTWPPPEELTFGGVTMVRIGMSQLTDEQAEEMTFIARGAEYVEKDHG
jgi:hypothetical protein